MRLLSVHSGNLYGGVERLLSTVVKHRVACPDLHLSFGLCFEGRSSAELRQLGADVYILGPARIRNPISVRRVRANLAALLAAEQFDVVITQMPWAQYLFGPVVRNFGLPNGCWIHDLPDGRHWLQRLASRKPPDFTIANSEFTASQVPLLFPGVPNFVLYPPVAAPDPAFAAARGKLRHQLGLGPQQVAILQTSRIEAYKGLGVLVEALAQLADDPRWQAFVVGGPQRPHESRFLRQVQRAAQWHGLGDRIRFLGERRDARQLMASADIFVQPNIRPEPFGLVFAEALYAGLPVVTSATGGPLEIFRGGYGVLLPPDSVNELAEALRRLVEDGDLRRQYQHSEPRRAEQLCNPTKQIQRLAVLLQQAVAGDYASPKIAAIGAHS